MMHIYICTGIATLVYLEPAHEMAGVLATATTQPHDSMRPMSNVQELYHRVSSIIIFLLYKSSSSRDLAAAIVHPLHLQRQPSFFPTPTSSDFSLRMAHPPSLDAASFMNVHKVIRYIITPLPTVRPVSHRELRRLPRHQQANDQPKQPQHTPKDLYHENLHKQRRIRGIRQRRR